MHTSSSSATDLLPGLRAATGEAHLRLEQAVNIEQRLKDQASYAELLKMFLGFYRPLEERLEAADGLEEHGYRLTERRKTPWLAADLRALGLSHAEVNALPNCRDLPTLKGVARSFGCLYVLEGATLGGRQITSLMRETPVPEDARRFFASYGPETGTRWREFIATLEAAGRATGEAGGVEIAEAARETFASMERWINERVPRP